MKHKLELSQFNITKILGDGAWVFNTLTSAFIKISASVWQHIFDTDDEHLLLTLRQQGFIVDSHETEINKYRYIYYNKMFDRRSLAVTIAPGEQKDVDMTIDNNALAYYDETTGTWKSEDGEFDALVGNASDNIMLKSRFMLK